MLQDILLGMVRERMRETKKPWLMGERKKLRVSHHSSSGTKKERGNECKTFYNVRLVLNSKSELLTNSITVKLTSNQISYLQTCKDNRSSACQRSDNGVGE